MSHSSDNAAQVPKWLSALAALALLAGLLVGFLALLNIGDCGLVAGAARWLSIGCGIVGAVVYIQLRKQDRARAALLGSLALLGGLLALGAWQMLETSAAEQAAGGQMESRETRPQ